MSMKEQKIESDPVCIRENCDHIQQECVKENVTAKPKDDRAHTDVSRCNHNYPKSDTHQLLSTNDRSLLVKIRNIRNVAQECFARGNNLTS